MSARKAKKSATQERLDKEAVERGAKMATQKANREKAEAKNKDALEQSAKRVAALYKSMREFEAHAEKKAGFELKKAAEKRAALEKALAEARELCKAAGQSFKAFKKKFAPDYGRTRLYQIFAIADGRTTAEDVREGARDRKRRQRAGESVRDKDVTDGEAEDEAKPEPEMETPGEPAAPVEQAEPPLVPPADDLSIPPFMRRGEAPAADDTNGDAAEQVRADFAALVKAANGKPDDERSLAKKLFNALNEALLLCADQNNWLHLSNNKKDKDELRAAVKKLKVVREALPRLAIPRPKPVVH